MADFNNHRNAALDQRHPPHNWEYDNAALREAASIPPADNLTVSNLKKWALQLDDNSLWMLIGSVEDTENPGTFLTEWKSMGANARAGYKYAGLRCNSVAFTNNTPSLSGLKFLTATGIDITPTDLFVSVLGEVALYELGAQIGEYPMTDLPIFIYGELPNAVADDITEIRIYMQNGEYGAFKDFEFIVSDDAEAWQTIRHFVALIGQTLWQNFYPGNKREAHSVDFYYISAEEREAISSGFSAQDIGRIARDPESARLYRCASVVEGAPTWAVVNADLFTSQYRGMNSTLDSSYGFTAENYYPINILDSYNDNDFTIPLASEHLLPVGTTVKLLKSGTNAITLVPEEGISIYSALTSGGFYPANLISGSGNYVELRHVYENSWFATGDLTLEEI